MSVTPSLPHKAWLSLCHTSFALWQTLAARVVPASLWGSGFCKTGQMTQIGQHFWRKNNIKIYIYNIKIYITLCCLSSHKLDLQHGSWMLLLCPIIQQIHFFNDMRHSLDFVFILPLQRLNGRLPSLLMYISCVASLTEIHKEWDFVVTYRFFLGGSKHRKEREYTFYDVSEESSAVALTDLSKIWRSL